MVEFEARYACMRYARNSKLLRRFATKKLEILGGNEIFMT